MKPKFGNPPHRVCEICFDDGVCSNNIFSKNYDKDFSDYLDCMLYLKKRKGLMKKLINLLRVGIPILLLSVGFSELPNDFRIEMLNERNFPMRVDRNGEYHIDISSKHQSIFKMKATTNRPKQTERITWSKNQTYLWSNGLVVDDYCLVNPSSYTKDGIGYSMVGFMPKMENSSVVIYGHYGTLTDSIVVHIE